MADLFGKGSIDSTCTTSRFDNILYRSPGAKKFFNLPVRSHVSTFGSFSNESCDPNQRPFLSPLSQILKQKRRTQPSRGNDALQGSFTLNEENPPSSSPLTSPSKRSLVQKQTTTAITSQTSKDLESSVGKQIIDEEEERRTLEQAVIDWPYKTNPTDTPQTNDMDDLIAESIMEGWYLTQPRKRIIVIEGHRIGDPEGELWHSSAISERIKPRLLVTSSGSKYRLRGSMNIAMTLENGFSPDTVKRFLNGFPVDWKEIIQEQCLRKEEDNRIKSEKPVPSETKPEAKKRVARQEEKSSKPKKEVKSTPITGGKQQLPKSVISKGGSNRSKLLTPDTTKAFPKDTLTTPAEFKTPNVISVDELKCTRSGRRVLPPLAYWTGERQRTNVRLDEVELIAGTTDHTHTSFNTPKLVGLKADTTVLEGSSVTSRVKQRHSARGSAKEQRSVDERRTTEARKTTKKSRRTKATRKESVSNDRAGKRGIRRDEPPTKKNKREKTSGFVPERTESSKTRASNRIKVNESTVGVKTKRRTEETESVSSESESELGQYWTRKSTRRTITRNRGIEEDLSTQNHCSGRGQSQTKKQGDVIGECDNKVVKVLEQTSDTESMKQARSQTRSIPTEKRKESLNFNLYGDILGILAKQKQRREEMKFQRRSSSSSPGSDPDVFDSGVNKSKLGTETTRNEASPEMPDESASRSNTRDRSSVGRRNFTRGKKSFRNDCTLTGSFQTTRGVRSSQDQTGSEHGDNKIASLRTEGENDGNEINKDTGKEVTRPASARTRTAQRNNERASDKENERGSDEWKEDEVERLESALRCIPGTSNDYWQRVSDKVGTRQIKECKAKKSSLLKADKVSGNTKKSTNETSRGPVTLNARKGTLRRKRQLRELAEHHNMGYEEDLLDNTPYKKTRRHKIPLCDGSDEESDDSIPCSKTPSLNMPNIEPFSTKKTPHPNWTPGLLQSVNRDKAEHYIYRMQKRKGRTRQKTTPVAGRPLTKFGTKQNKFQSRFSDKELQQAFEVKEITEEDDSDQEKDYYWSDEEEEEDGMKA
ncbi:uncharacterized protein [Apostichopus japonicus]|uniref:uncharacterized protein isoform X2 n=1 Tax=Stichopus japonicus TaxID=307972 RepID=UPI003AB29D50